MHIVHLPVMVNEVLEALYFPEGGTIVDATFGAGGYTKAILQKSSNLRVVAIDRDEEAIKKGGPLQQEYASRLTLVHGRFGDLQAILGSLNITKVSGIVADLGMSSMQLDNLSRGFSFNSSDSLDMRMGLARVSAMEFIAKAKAEDIAGVLYNYGQERRSRAIARAIVERRSVRPITCAQDLAEIVRSVLRQPKKKRGMPTIDPATKTFMALRIHVNEELAELQKLLDVSKNFLHPGGRLVTVSFHSLEDAMIKEHFNNRSNKLQKSRYLPPLVSNEKILWHSVYKKPICPGEEEVKTNPRARSAKLRAGEIKYGGPDNEGGPL